MRIKLASIYIITHTSGYFYLGQSLDTFTRWSSHYTNIKLNSHSSIKFKELWNSSCCTEWTFSILEYVSITEYKKVCLLKGKELKRSFMRHLQLKEREWMSKYSINLALNKDKKYFK